MPSDCVWLQTMDLAKQLGTVCQERLQLSQQARDPEPAISASLEAASKRKLHLEQELEGAAQRTSATQAEKEAGEEFRGTSRIPACTQLCQLWDLADHLHCPCAKQN